MALYQKYKDAQGRKTGPWFIKYPIGRNPITSKIKYKIEKVGYTKKWAERACQKKMVEWAEGKFLDIREESNMTFSQLVEWFLELPVVRQNKTIKDIERACRDLESFFGQVLIKDIRPAMVEKYQSQRLQEPTWTRKPRSAANVNRTIAVLKRMFNLAVREDLVTKNPCWKIKMLPENNVRDRVLSAEEMDRLFQHLPRHAALVVRFTYLTGMRAGEIFNLSWDKVDLKKRIIRLEAEDTKNSEPRVIYLSDEVLGILNEAGKVKGFGHNRVFGYRGQPMAFIKNLLQSCLPKSRHQQLPFPRPAHTFNTNMRKAGVDQSVIMKLTGHKTSSMFQRYTTVDIDDARNAYQKLEEHLSKEHGQDGTPEEKCSHSAPKRKIR